MMIVATHTDTPTAADWRLRYEVREKIGSGGSAEVFAAWDRERRRPVALKVVDERRGLTARVLREVECSAALDHPGIVPLLDWFSDGRRSYLVSELVEGEPLAAAAARLDDVSAVEAAAQVLEAVAHAHGQGVVHRDIKPQNIMVREDGRAMVMDFGIARLLDADTLTGEGDMVGTVAYMSPEQAAGHRVGPATDVYSAGVVLFELLAGVSPVRGSTPAETISTIVSGRTLPLDSVRPDLPPELLDGVAAALALAPSQRPTAVELAAVLRQVLADGQLTRRPLASAPGRFQVMAERFGGAALGGVAAGVLLQSLPAYPRSWTLPLAVFVAASWALLPGAGLALLLGVLAFPLFNVSAVLGGLYAAGALFVLLIARRRPVCVVWPVGALLLAPAYLTLLAPAGAAVLGRRRGPLTAAWSAATVTLYLTLTGRAASPFAGSQAGSSLADELAAAGDPLTAAARLAGALLDPACIAQMAVWAGMALAVYAALGRRRPDHRLWIWAMMFAVATAATALVPAALGRQVSLGSLLTSVAAAATVVVLPLLWTAGGFGRWRRGARSADR